jgi:hypothetical protein
MAINVKYCVPGLATGSNDGSSEANAFQDLSDAETALAAAAAGAGIGDGWRIYVKRSASRYTEGAANSEVALATGGTATATVEWIGYETTPGDNGMYQTGNAIESTGSHTLIANFDCEIAAAGDDALNARGNNTVLWRCRGVNTAENGEGIEIQSGEAYFCYAEANGASSDYALYCNDSLIYGCFAKNSGGGTSIETFAISSRTSTVINCIAVNDGTGNGIEVIGMNDGDGVFLHNNIVYNTANAIDFLTELPDFEEPARCCISHNILYKCTNCVMETDAGSEEATIWFIRNAVGDYTNILGGDLDAQCHFNGITLADDPFEGADNNNFALNPSNAAAQLLINDGFRIQMPYDFVNMQPVPTITNARLLPADTTIDQYPALVEVTTAQVTLSVNPDRAYTIVHTGKDTNGATAEDVVIVSLDTNVTATWAEGTNKLPLQSGKTVAVGPGINNIALKQPAGSSATTVTVVPDVRWMGNF